jgi:phospholipase C
VLDFTSALKFIEENYDLPPLAERDAKANSISNAFDFSQPPREPRIVPSTRTETKLPIPRRAVLYATYSAALLLPTALITWALLDPGGRSWRPVIGGLRLLRNTDGRARMSTPRANWRFWQRGRR